MKTSKKKPFGNSESGKKSFWARTWLLPIMPALTTGVIGGIFGIVSTLIATGNLPPRRQEGTTATASTSAPRSPVLDAPFLYFSSKTIDDSLPECMKKAQADLERLRLTGSEARGYIAWGYQNETTGLVWCNTDEKVVIYIAAGRNDQKALDLADALRKSF